MNRRKTRLKIYLTYCILYVINILLTELNLIINATSLKIQLSTVFSSMHILRNQSTHYDSTIPRTVSMNAINS